MNFMNSMAHLSFSIKRIVAVVTPPSTLTPFTPRDLSGLWLWLDSSDTSTITQTSNAISSWTDKSTNAFNFTQATAGQKPTYVTNSQNGLSTVSFTRASSQYLISPYNSLTNVNVGYNSIAIFLVVKLNTTDRRTGTNFDNFFNKSIYSDGPNTGRIITNNDSGGFTLLLQQQNGIVYNTKFFNTSTNFQLLCFVINRYGTGSANTASSTTLLNGSVQSTVTYNPNTTINLTNNYDMILGAYNSENGTGVLSTDTANSFLDGQIAEVVSYQNLYDMTEETRQKIEGYLAWKWGINNLLPTFHSYYNNRPVNISSNTNTINKLIPGVTPWGIYDASLFSGSTLPEARGITSKNATSTGIIDYSVVSGNGTTASISQIAGNISSTLLWPAGSIPAGNFTICAITRYTGSTNKNRILTSTGNPSTNNSFFGHSGSGVGSTYYNSAQRSNAISATATDWLIICCRSGGSTASNTVYLNNVPSGTALGGTGSADILGINKYYNGTSITETSDWALSYVIIYDSVLTDAQMATVSTKLREYLPIPTTFTVYQPSYLQFNYRFNTGDIVSNKLANYASGTAVYDASVNAGASIVSTAGNVAFGSGSMYFNGSASIQLPSFTTDLNGVSISCWFKSSSGQYARVCDFANQSSDSGGNNIVISPYDGVQITKTTVSSITTPAVNLNNNAWQHLIFTSEKIIDANDTSGNFRLYINGVVNNTYSNSNFFYPPALTRTLNYLGVSNYPNYPAYLTGYVDEFKLYKKALSATEAKNLYYYNNTTLSFNSLTFNGTNQYGILSDPTYYTDSFDSVGGTIEVWFKTTTNNTNYTPLISKDILYAIFIVDGKITVYNWGGSLKIDSGISVADGKWHHVAITFKSGTSTNCIYIDGVFIKNYSFTYDTANYNISANFNKTLKIGSYNNMQQYFTGSIANLRIWNTQKTAAQISQIYNKYIDPALNSDLIGFYSFNEGSGTTVNNNSSRNRYAFDLSNSPVWSSVDIPTIKRNQGVLPSIPDGCRGLYACKWVNSNYTGPILKLRKSSQADNTNATNFYIDKTGTVVTTLPDASGTTFASWLGTDPTAYVNVWYDQSLLAKDASQNLVDNQPIFTLADGVSITGLGTSSRYLVLPNDNFAFSATSPYPYYGSYTFTYKISNVETLTPKANVSSYNAVFLYGLHSGSSEIYNAIDTSPSSGHKIYNGMWGNPISSYDTSYEGGTVQPKTVITSTYAYTSGTAGSNNIIGTLNIYANGLLKGTGPGSTNNILKKGDSMNTITPGVDTNFSNTIGTPRNELYIQNFRGSLKYLSMFGSVLTTNDRLSMENIDDTIINKNFSQSITGTSQIVYNETPVIGWTLSAVDNSNVTFLIASVLDTVYLEGTMTSSPYTVLPSSITQFMVSKLTASGYSQSITQTIAITSAGYYTFSFYHAGRTGTNLYSSSHTLTVTLGSTTIVANLTTSTLGWQQYTGYLEFSTLDIGTKDLIFTFSSSSSLNSSYYITGVDFVFTSPMALYSSVPVGSVGLFACRWVNNLYTGPILQLRNASTIQDFYMDRTGTVITTGPNGTGTPFASWIGGATAYVVIWYDQSVTGSTGGRNATMTLSNGEKNQPTFTTTDKIMFANNGLNSQFLILPTSMFLNGNNPYTMSYKIKNGTGITTSTHSTVLLYGTRLTSENHLFINPSSTSTIFYNGGWAQSNASKTITSWVQPNTIITNKYESNTRSIYYNGEFANSGAYTLNFTNGPSVSSINTTGTQAYSSGSNTIGSGRNEQYVYNLGGSLDFISLFTTALNDQDRIKIEKIDDIYSPFIVNGNFIDYITGTSQTVLNSNPVINWTLSTVDSSNVKFLISKTTDSTYARGASATAPFVTLPATITQFMVSQIITAGYSQTISQLVKVASAGTYTLTFYYAGRSTASSYTVNHTLTVSFGSTTLVTNLTASTSGWQLYTGTVTMATADIGIKNLKFTFYNGETYDSSYYITGVNVVYSSNLNTINTNTINNLIPGVTPWGIYDASLFTGSTLPEARGFTAKNATSTGTITVNSAISGNGTTASIPQIAGTNASTMLWPTGSLPQKFTIFSISRYVTTPTGNDKTIITNYSSTLARLFVHSHWNSIGSILGFYYGGWNNDTNDITTTLNNPSTNWASVCSRNASSASTGITSNYNFMANNQTKGTSFPSTDNSSWTINEKSLCINKETYSANNDWDWAFTYLIIYDSVLTDSQVATVSNKLQNYLATGSMVDSYTTSISRAIYPSVPTGSVGLYACKWVNHNYKGPILKLRRNNDATTGTTGATLQDFYMDKTGTVVTTAPDGSGNTFATWLSTNSATSAYVVIWYDQSVTGSGGGNNATTSLTTNTWQPLYDSTTNSVFFNGNQLNLPSTILPTGNNQFSYTFKLNNLPTTASNYAFAIGDWSTDKCLFLTISNTGFINNVMGFNGSPGYNRVPTLGDVITCDYDKAKLNIYNKGTSTAVASSTAYTTFNLDQTAKNTNVIGGIFNSSAAAYSSSQNIANIKYSYFSIFNTVLTTTNRQLMENIDDTVSNRNFGQPITGTSQLVSNDTPVYGWTLSAIDNTNSAFLIATTSDTTTYTRGTNVASPYVALPATITQFLVSQIVTAGSSHTVTQSVAITSAGYYSFTFYHAGRSTASSYSTNHTLSITLGTTTIVSGLSTNATGWQQYAGVLTLATGDIGTKTLTFTFTSSTANSSFYVTGVDISLSGLIINTLSNNTTIIKDLIPGVTPWGIYDASLWNGSIKFLPEARGITARDASGSGAGTFTYNSAISGNGAVASVPQISGTTSSLMTWPSGSIPFGNNFTMCAITRYTNSGGNQQRILTSFSTNDADTTNNNFVLGHYNSQNAKTASGDSINNTTGARGPVYFQGVVKSTLATTYGTKTDWLVICGKSGSNGTAVNSVLADGLPIGLVTGGASTGNGILGINNCGGNQQQSDWAFTYLVIYDSVLSDIQMATVSTKLQNYLIYGTMADSYTTSISRAIYPSVPTGSVGLYACKWVNHLYKGPILKLRRNNDATTGTTGATLQDFYMDKTGTVITTAPDGSGTTFANWLSTNSATSAYVVIWYDQTLGGNHGIQGTIAYQPKLVLFNGLYTVYFYTAGGADPVYMGLTKPAFNTGNNSFTIIYKIPDTTLITSSDFKMAFSTGSNSSAQKIQQGFLNRAIIHTWYGGNGATYTPPTWSNNLIVSCDYNSASPYSKNIYLNGASTTVTTAGGTLSSLSLTYSTSTPDIYGCIGALGGEYSSGSIINTTYCLTGSISHLSLYNNMLGTTNRQLMENIDDTIVNRNFGQPIPGTSQFVSNYTPVYGWTLSAIDYTNSAFYIATTSDTIFARGTNVASPYVALPTNITQFLVSQIVTAGYSHTVTQSVAITSAGYYSLTFYHAGRSTANSYSPNHTLTVTLGTTTIVSGLSSNASGWQQYAGVLTLASGDIGTKTLTFTFTSTTANSSFYVTGVDISLSGLIINTLSNNTTIIKDLIPGVTPWGIYDASLWNGSIKFLPEARGITTRDASGSGTGFTFNSGISGNGATASVPQISGTTTSLMTWPSGSIPSTYTLCAITRYTNSSANQGRILATITPSNFLIGHYAGLRGIVYDKDFKTEAVVGITGTKTDWLTTCAKNSAGVGSVLVNGSARGTSIDGSGNYTMAINQNGSNSEWAFTYLVIYDSILTDAQMASVSTKLQNYLNYGNMALIPKDPKDFSGLWIWLDGSDTSKITQTSNAISTWTDKSTNAFSFSQATAGKKPTYVANSQNGLSTLSFASASNQYLGGPTSFSVGTNSLSIFIVFKFNSSDSYSNYESVFGKSYLGDQLGRFYCYRYGTSMTFDIQQDSPQTATYPLPSFTNNSTSWQIVELIVNRPEGKSYIFQNGTQVSTKAYTTNTSVNLTNTNPLIVGEYNNTSYDFSGLPNYNLNGSIAEIVGYSTSTDMTPVTRQTIEGYLAWKWGLQTVLPSDHPYKNSAPTK